jgi:hypothetical protein
MDMKWYLTIILIGISLAINDVRHGLRQLLWENVCLSPLLIFELGCFVVAIMGRFLVVLGVFYIFWVLIL